MELPFADQEPEDRASIWKHPIGSRSISTLYSILYIHELAADLPEIGPVRCFGFIGSLDAYNSKINIDYYY